MVKEIQFGSFSSVNFKLYFRRHIELNRYLAMQIIKLSIIKGQAKISLCFLVRKSICTQISTHSSRKVGAAQLSTQMNG